MKNSEAGTALCLVNHYMVEIFDGSGKVIKSIGPSYSYRQAERVERGIRINLGRNFDTQIITKVMPTKGESNAK